MTVANSLTERERENICNALLFIHFVFLFLSFVTTSSIKCDKYVTMYVVLKKASEKDFNCFEKMEERRKRKGIG